MPRTHENNCIIIIIIININIIIIINITIIIIIIEVCTYIFSTYCSNYRSIFRNSNSYFNLVVRIAQKQRTVAHSDIAMKHILVFSPF